MKGELLYLAAYSIPLYDQHLKSNQRNLSVKPRFANHRTVAVIGHRVPA